MKKRLFSLFALAIGLQTVALSQKNEWRDPEVNAVNRARCTLIILLMNHTMLPYRC